MCKDRGALHQRIRKTFGFPDYYGENWDVMRDCLADVFLQPVQRCIIVEGFAAMSQELREYTADYRHNKTCGQIQKPSQTCRLRRFCMLKVMKIKVQVDHYRAFCDPTELLGLFISPAFLAAPCWRLFCSYRRRGCRYPAWRRAGCGRGYPLPLSHVRTARDHQAGSGVAQAVDIELLSVDVPPLQGAALAAPHPRGNDKLKVCLILDALIFQCGDDFLRRFFVGNLFPCFLTCVARHGSGDRTPISMEYVFCCELRVSFMAGRLALPRLALNEEIDVPISGNVLSSNGLPVMSRFG